MKVLVTGSRDFPDLDKVHDRIALLAEADHLIVGDARGVDRVATDVALKLGREISIFKARWKDHGKMAGPWRNQEMVDQEPDLVLAFWDGKSRGTRDCIDRARAAGIPVEVISP